MTGTAGGGLEPLSGQTLHVAIDMQRLFADRTAWHVPALVGILPAVARLGAARPSQTLFARFIPAERPELAEGRWRRYYERWADVTGERLGAGGLDLVPPLVADRPDAAFGKRGYSIFGAPDFVTRLDAERIDTLVLTGVETDVCVLASLFGAVDRGLRVVVPTDAVASASVAAHAAVIDHLLPRLGEQVDLSTIDEVLRAWPDPRTAGAP